MPKEYKTCCGLCHVKNAAIIIAFICLFGAFASAYEVITYHTTLALYVYGIWTVICTMEFILLIMSSQERDHRYILPALMLLSLESMWIVAMMVMMIVSPDLVMKDLMGLDRTKYIKFNNETMLKKAWIMLIIAQLIQVWMVVAVNKYWKYMKSEEEKHFNDDGNVIFSSDQAYAHSKAENV